MPGLFGSAPSTSQSSQPTVLPSQLDVLTLLGQLLQNGGTPPGVTPLQGPFSAPLQPLQLTSLEGLQNLANNPTPQPVSQGSQNVVDSSQNALLNLLNNGAPQINAGQVIQQSVVDPLMKNFNDNILPAIIGQYAGSAGGTYSSDALKARQQAGQNLEGQIASEAGNLGFTAAQANQNADLQALTQAFGAAPNLAALPTNLAAGQQGLQQGNENLLASLLQAGGVPYQVAETGVQGNIAAQTNTQDQIQQFLRDMIATFSPGTVSNTTTVNPGSAGLLPSLIGGIAGNSGLGTAAGNWLFG